MSIYEDVEISLLPPVKFTFRNTFGYFDGDETKTEIEYLSDALNTNPITIPVPYMTAGNKKFDCGWNDGSIDMADVALQVKINNWTSNPDADVVINVNAYDQADPDSLVNVTTRPTKTSYNVGESFNPSGLEFEAYDSLRAHTKKISYDAEQYNRLFKNKTYYYDTNKNLISTNVMTLATKYAAVYFNDCVYALSEVSVKNPTPPTPPTPPSPDPYYPEGGSSSGESSSPSVGPMGDLTKNPLYQQQFVQQGQINSTNNIPQNNLVVDVQLAITLFSLPENENIPMSNVIDANGNTGFGKWGKVPGTNTWYFLTGDLTANGTLGTAGFVSTGLYNLSWGTSSGWYSFNAKGEMQTGWQSINGKRYYFEPNASVSNFGMAAVGMKTIDGQVYNFDANGALVG